ncbi:MAG: hypothetical protein FWC92_07075 [Defluviitaleaceae bacterium]|nr:hypothetical protein [Defluviitaleaceae bacterium]
MNNQQHASGASWAVVFITLTLMVGTWVVIVISWFMYGEYPDGLMSFTQWLTVFLLGQCGLLCVEKCVKCYCHKGGR